MAISLTDIRCGCGGLCDSGEPCPMRGNVQVCTCGNTTVTHAISLAGCLRARRLCPCGSREFDLFPCPTVQTRMHRTCATCSQVDCRDCDARYEGE